MPLNLDSCIAGVFTPGNIGASSGMTPVEPTVPSLDGIPPLIIEVATASDALDYFMGELLHEVASASDSYTALGGAFVVSISEAASATDHPFTASVYDVVVGEVSGGTADIVSVYEPGVFSDSIAEAATATDAVDATTAASASAPDPVSAARAGIRSMLIGGAAGKTQIIPGTGAVT